MKPKLSEEEQDEQYESRVMVLSDDDYESYMRHITDEIEDTWTPELHRAARKAWFDARKEAKNGQVPNEG